jgi:dihydroxyacetone kinase-like protein
VSNGIVTLERFRDWLLGFAREIEANKDYLTRLDSAIGDADHGINMDRGMKAVVAKIEAEPLTSVEALFKSVGMTLVSSIGGASGPLYGTFFLRFGMAAGESDQLSADSLAKAFRSGLDGVVARGKAEAGDKTMFDALAPALEALEVSLEGGRHLAEALEQAALAAEAGRDATIEMLARKGRASYLVERSVGHQDPGATSSALLVRVAAATLS